MPALRPPHLTWAGLCAGLCAEVAQLEGLWGKGAEDYQLVVVWEGMDTPGRDGCHTAWREGGIPQEGNKTRQLMIWEKEAFNYLHAFVASSATCDASVSSFMYNLQIICVFFKKKKSAGSRYSGQQCNEWLYF